MLLHELYEDVKKYTDPNFDTEWEEANRYPEFVKLGKAKWIALAKTGRVINVDNALSNKIENTEAGEKYRHAFDELEADKKERFYNAAKAGEIELPIIASYSDGRLELVAGNTRLTGMMSMFGSAKAWIFDVPSSIDEGPRDMGVSDLGTKDAVQNQLDYVYNDSARGRVRQGKAEEINDGTFEGHTIKKFDFMEHGVDIILYFLVDKNDTPVFYIALAEYEDGLAVTNVLSKGKVRATSFYYHLLQNETDALYSDTKQTAGGQKLWRDLENSYPITVTNIGDRLKAEVS